MDVEQLEPETGDPLDNSVQGALIKQVSTQCRGASAHEDLAVVELRVQGGACLTDKRDLVCS